MSDFSCCFFQQNYHCFVPNFRQSPEFNSQSIVNDETTESFRIKSGTRLLSVNFRSNVSNSYNKSTPVQYWFFRGFVPNFFFFFTTATWRAPESTVSRIMFSCFTDCFLSFLILVYIFFTVVIILVSIVSVWSVMLDTSTAH